jgi:hypothetical protein
MPSTTVHALRYPALGDVPNVPLDVQRLADDVERELVEHDASLTAALARPAGVRVKRTTAATATTAVYHLATWEAADSPSSDGSDGTWTVATASRLKAPVSGRYRVTVAIPFAANTAGFRQVVLRKNSAGSSAGGTVAAVGNASANSTGLTAMASVVLDEFYMAAGDYIEAFAYQNSGGDLAAYSAGGLTANASISYIGA